MCPLCDRPVPLTRHHVRLRRRAPKLVLDICKECQQVVHGLFPGTLLARRPDLWTVEGLRAEPSIVRALVFVRKLSPGTSTRMKQRKS